LNETRAIYLASILAMVSIFALDLSDGPKVWLHVLYVFPISTIAFHSERGSSIVIGVITAIAFQLLTLIAYDMSAFAILINLIVALASGALIAVLTRMARLNIARIEALAVTDSLTGVHNRRGLESVVDREIARQRRYGGVFSLVILDLDRFKQLNDFRGHDVGDLALRLIGDVLRDTTRRSDSIARLGGDEFAVVMPNTPKTECATLCRYLSTTIACRMARANFAITASIGSATFEQAPDSVSTALRIADGAMYAVKLERSVLTNHRNSKQG
jgi:diguanylate cyclase (GGDEF)-like protein